MPRRTRRTCILRSREAGPTCCLEFAIQFRQIAAGWKEQISVHACKVAVDLVFVNDLLDTIDSRGMAFRRKPAAVRAMKILEVVIPVVQGRRKMRGGAARFATASRPVIHDDDPSAFFRQQVRGGQTGNPGADDADIGGDVAREWWRRCNVGSYHPVGHSTAIV